jgi:hypothetical protein
VRCLFLIPILIVAICIAAPAQAAGNASEKIGIYTDEKIPRVGIGTTSPLTTLDVSKGEIKLGSTGAPCTAALAGAIRYAEARLQLCDGAGWRNLCLDKAQ